MNTEKLRLKTAGFYNYLKESGIKNKDLVEITGADKGNVSKYVNKKLFPPAYFITTLENFLKVDFTTFIKDNTTSNNFNNLSEVKQKHYTTSLEVKIVTTKARAGYSDAYYSDEYLNDLPTVLIEADREYKGKYLAFEVDGDSMEPDYNKGDIVICREVQRHLWQYKLHYKDYDFVIAHGTKGIMLKEIINHNPETGEITCHSLNNDDGQHEDFVLNLKEVAFLYNVVEHRISGKSKRRNR